MWPFKKAADNEAEKAMSKAVEDAKTANRSAVKGLVDEALSLIAERKQKERPSVEPVPDATKD